MARLCKNRGFSLTEVLIAVGILAVGMTFIAGVFPAGIYLTTIATERTIAAVAADEAFAKIRIYAVGDLSVTTDDVDLAGLKTNELTDFNGPTVFPATANIDPNEFAYPSDPGIDVSEKQYCWSALCRRAAPDPNRLVQVTVFVCRKVSKNLKYHDPNVGGTVNWPMPVRVGVEAVVGADNELRIRSRPGAYDDKTFINDGYTIVDDATGRIYRVLERYKSPDDRILLDRKWDDKDWQGNTILLPKVWVVPPPVNGGRYPCIAVYQKVIRF
jgi:prepilin-type N-terminal cleavage/methylation domain-containing protein